MKKLLLAVAIFAASLVVAPAAEARPDGRLLIAACMTMDEQPTMSGVVGIIRSMIEMGYSPYQAGEVLGVAVRDVCPEHAGLVERFADAITDTSSYAIA